ncbi:tyrosine-type recombinase/integrase [Pseudonocardia sp. Cha107L01]|uniref:tyrosine-type recombinase/integrase n=1 Tax=Pseudonocardia sp. Cha107L01 TaxID=3457576 RepID=UPI00403E9D7E
MATALTTTVAAGGPAVNELPSPATVAGHEVTGELLATLDVEHPVLAGWPTRERVMAATWLAGYRSARTRRAYAADLAAWLAWLTDRRIDVLSVRRIHVDLWTRGLLDAGAASSSVARRLSAVSSWYRHLGEHDLVTANPAAAVRRPRVDPDHTTTVGLDRDQARALLAAADTDTGPTRLRAAAPIRVLLHQGLRVDELARADVADLGHDRGPAATTADRVAGRPPVASTNLASADVTGPLLATSTGGRLDQAALWHVVRRLARAGGIEHWAALSPHSLRHSAITLALDAGASLRDVQDFAGHRDPRTTRRYDRSRHSLDRNASYTLAAYLA